MEPKNLLFIMADEHNRDMLSCAGHGLVNTPNLDELAARGTRFTSAYTNNPICVPSRAAFQTGNYTNRTRYWDNTLAYDGGVPGWGHRLQQAGIRVESIGKLHYRRDEDPLGYDARHIPMYIKDGVGSVTASIRDPLPALGDKTRTEPGFAAKAGPGSSSYTQYDARVADLACDWLREAGEGGQDRPWVLFASFLSPHYPLTVPPEFLDLYPASDMPDPKLGAGSNYVPHPWVQVLAERQPHNNGLTAVKSRMAMAAYLGLCSYVDAQIGRLLDTLASSGQMDATRVIYASDHGENAGARGLWGKSVMYEESAGIPLILAGPDVDQGALCRTPVSLVDVYPSVLAASGQTPDDREADLPGHSLFDIAGSADHPDRLVFSEYHASASPSGAFMVRKGRFKYTYYVGYRPELYDLDTDPAEINDLAGDPAYGEICSDHEALLRTLVDPEAADRQAKDDQNAIVDFHGGRDKVLRDDLGGGSFTRVPDTVTRA